MFPVPNYILKCSNEKCDFEEHYCIESEREIPALQKCPKCGSGLYTATPHIKFPHPFIKH